MDIAWSGVFLYKISDLKKIKQKKERLIRN